MYVCVTCIYLFVFDAGFTMLKKVLWVTIKLSLQLTYKAL